MHFAVLFSVRNISIQPKWILVILNWLDLDMEAYRNDMGLRWIHLTILLPRGSLHFTVAKQSNPLFLLRVFRVLRLLPGYKVCETTRSYAQFSMSHKPFYAWIFWKFQQRYQGLNRQAVFSEKRGGKSIIDRVCQKKVILISITLGLESRRGEYVLCSISWTA